ncbi:MAG: acetoacetate--CoA ligase [Alphaproteobacteria bacterium]|nr:acetoacetate--CoA ligase [Alphaproteobacteria bacterium]
MTDNILWSPSPKAIQAASLTRFMDKLKQDRNITLATYEDLYTYSLLHPEQFWKGVWDFCALISETQGERFLIDADNLEKAKFFPDARLNFAENLLRRRDDSIALTFYGEDQVYQTLTYQDLYHQTIQLAQVFKRWGIQPGDRIAGYLPNIPHTVIAMLAAASLGAIWSSCSPDFGVQGVVDRFSQIKPTVFLMADGYYYGGKVFSCLDRLPPIRDALPSLKKVILIPYITSAQDLKNQNISPQIEIWEDLLTASPPEAFTFPQLPFNHPLYILYSSGTTGVPKCIIHGAGGTLLQHLKEHQLHCDIKPDDKVFYYTTCGWMMWNWLVSALASGASLVLYDGSPLHPHPEFLFEIAEKEGITLFGTSAKFIDTLAKNNLEPHKKYALASLRMVTSTGSPLCAESFDYAYRAIKKDMCLASISGGTDIVSCFALGNPIAPVRRGELQCRGLGLAVRVFDEAGQEIRGQKGELVCTQPFPSQPLGFWNDPDGEKYHNAYFKRFPNVWHHGDFVELTPHDGLIIYGRSDTVLNPGGVRIGTAEIYHQVDKIEDILESIAIGQQWKNDVRIILFVHLKGDIPLSDALIEKIKDQIRRNTSPRHVPAKIIAVTDIPRTKNGKLAESAVRDTVHGEVNKNHEALANPDVLDQFKNREELTQD